MAKINRVHLQSEIIKFIQNYIVENSVKPGEKLPSQSDLVKMLGVSIPTLREALRSLEAKGILTIKNGKGIYVCEESINRISVEVEFSKEKESILEMLEARLLLEQEIIRLVIERATDKEIEEIGKVLELLMEKYYKNEKQNMIDKKFHHLFYEYCHNGVMQQLILSIEKLLDALWEFPLGLNSPFTETIPWHVDLYEYVKKRDIKKAQMINEKIIKRDMEEVKNA